MRVDQNHGLEGEVCEDQEEKAAKDPSKKQINHTVVQRSPSKYTFVCGVT